MTSNVTQQNFTNITKLVRDYKSDILNYYPYGPNTQWSYWLCGDIDLKKEYKDERNKGKTEKDYIISIISEVNRAMHYLTINGNYNAHDQQRLKAFSLCALFQYGEHGWTKNNMHLPALELDKHIAYHSNRANQINGSGKYASKETKVYEKNRLKSMSKEERVKYDSIMRNAEEHDRKTNGVYEVDHFPLIGANRKIFYTKQQLAAIDLLVACAFENLC